MDALILDLNDQRLALWRAGEQQLLSPGYALLQGKQYLFGEEARKQARLHPRDINHRFWWQLDTEPLQPAFGPGRHSADLVHAHLLEIHRQGKEPEQLILAAPGSMHTEQLSLLLGIIQRCPFTAVGLVDRAVASCCLLPMQPQACHIDLQLHQTLVSQLSLVGEELQRKSATPVPGCGWLAIQDRLAKTIGDSFIRQTRFDPRRQAATEQQLYDALPRLLQSLREAPEYNLELGGHRARIERQELVKSCTEIWQRIGQSCAPGQQIILDPFAGLLPGLSESFDSPQVLGEEALGQGIAANQQALVGDESGLHFVTRLPAGATAAASSPAPAPIETPVPVEASSPSRYNIEVVDGRCEIHPQSGPAPRVNGETVTGSCRLQAGDQVELGNGEILTLTRTAGDHGT